MKLSPGIFWLLVALGTLSSPAYTKHYSFVGGYPANAEINSSAAKAIENGGAIMTATAKTRQHAISAEKSIVGRVTKVSDGDTIWVTPNGGRSTKVRMRRIDAPEADQPGGDKATAFLKGLISGKSVEVRYSERDDHGRVLGTVFFKNEKGLVDANLTMILNGWAWHDYSFKANDKIPAYDKAEQAAQNAKIGVWSAENPVRPYDWRKGRR